MDKPLLIVTSADTATRTVITDLVSLHCFTNRVTVAHHCHPYPNQIFYATHASANSPKPPHPSGIFLIARAINCIMQQVIEGKSAEQPRTLLSEPNTINKYTYRHLPLPRRFTNYTDESHVNYRYFQYYYKK